MNDAGFVYNVLKHVNIWEDGNSKLTSVITMIRKLVWINQIKAIDDSGKRQPWQVILKGMQ